MSSDDRREKHFDSTCYRTRIPLRTAFDFFSPPWDQESIPGVSKLYFMFFFTYTYINIYLRERNIFWSKMCNMKRMSPMCIKLKVLFISTRKVVCSLCNIFSLIRCASAKPRLLLFFYFYFYLRRIVFANETLYGDRPFIFFENPT